MEESKQRTIKIKLNMGKHPLGEAIKKSRKIQSRTDRWAETHETLGPTSEAMKPKSINQYQNPQVHKMGEKVLQSHLPDITKALEA